jgi:hypothetical protein
MRFVALVLSIVAATATAARAQPPQPIPPVVIDLRGFYPNLNQDPATAADLGVVPTDLPGRAIGGVVAAQFYPLRKTRVAIGVGGEFLIARGRHQTTDENGTATSPRIEQRLQGMAASVSLNFGHRDGWSYLSAGMGPLRFESFAGDVAPAEAPPRKSTINMGGGARWFPTAHVAFCFDVRFYLTRPQEATGSSPGRSRNRILIMSAGIAVR